MFSILPTEMNLNRRKLEKGLAGLLEEIINMRTDAVKEGGSKYYGNDLLGLMLAAARKDTASVGGKVHFGMQALIGECKTFFFAGHETTASLLTWALMFLGTHTEWQDQARKEVMDLCKDGCPPNLETINKMKVVSGCLNCTLCSTMFNSLPIIQHEHFNSRCSGIFYFTYEVYQYMKSYSCMLFAGNYCCRLA